MNASRKKLLIAAAVLVALLVGVFVAYRLALSELRSRVLTALGPDSEIGEIDLSFRAIQITGLKLKAPAGWPGKHTLSAERVVIVPDLASLLDGSVNISSITVERTYLSVLRDRNGKIRVVPGLTERTKDMAAGKSPASSSSSSSPIPILIGQIALKDSSLSFFDAEVRSPPLEVKLSEVEARVTRLRIPELSEKSDVKLSAKIKGPAQSGTLNIEGQAVFASKDSELKTTIRGVDIASLEPYLIKKAETGVRRGTLDLDLQSKVAAQQIRAPGVLKLKDLELRSEGGIGTFMGMPRDSMVSMLRERDGSITVPFSIEGNLNDPGFDVDAAFKAKVGLATATALGVSIKDLMGTLGKDKGEGAAKVIDAFKGLLGR
ncbi:MAG: DUF748 domain-containing protein [Betaproteobacteria bacterium]|nr:DUF748 domain-containing protein [Betaproteobacteria bacterium]